MNVLIHNGQSYEGKLPVQHCPSNSGCRAIIQQKDNNNKVFSLTENVLITLKVSVYKHANTRAQIYSCPIIIINCPLIYIFIYLLVCVLFLILYIL